MSNHKICIFHIIQYYNNFFQVIPNSKFALIHRNTIAEPYLALKHGFDHKNTTKQHNIHTHKESSRWNKWSGLCAVVAVRPRRPSTINRPQLRDGVSAIDINGSWGPPMRVGGYIMGRLYTEECRFKIRNTHVHRQARQKCNKVKKNIDFLTILFRFALNYVFNFSSKLLFQFRIILTSEIIQKYMYFS